MGKVGEAIAGAALIAGAVVLDVTSMGAGLGLTGAETSALSSMVGGMGASLAMSGVAGMLAGRPPSHGVAVQNPIKPWDIVYGESKVDGCIIDIESNGGILSGGSNTYNKCLQFVVMLAAHPIQSVEQVRLNGKTIPLGAGGNGAQSTTWTYTPSSNQNQTSISSISRSGGVVTLKLTYPLSGMNGLQLSVRHVVDDTYNGIWTVTQPNPSDATTFTYMCGGTDGSSSGGYVLTCYPDYKNRVHCDLTSCLGTHASTFPEFLSTSNLWTPAHKNLGKASVYIAFYYDSGVFASGYPTMSFVVRGKNNIYDPRLNSGAGGYTYTNNAALVIADYLSDKTWGYGLNYGTDIPTEQLIAAANLCDEQVSLAAGGTESRYTINGTFNLARTRGEVLQDMLAACAGRISYQSGQYIILPGAWVAPSLSLSQRNLIGPVEYKPRLPIHAVCNGVKGAYTSPVNNWQPGDIPPYAEDTLHGFVSDRWLAADGGSRIWKDSTFHYVTSCSQAQRLAKIELERVRREGRLTLHCDMSAYPAVMGDVIEFSYPRYGWTNKTFEVLSSKRVLRSSMDGSPPALGVDLDLAEMDPTVYDWTTAEQLTPADVPYPSIDLGQSQSVFGPQFLEIQSGPSTAYVGADGIVIPRILASWFAAPDAQVVSGGYVQVEYQRVGDAYWTPAGTVNGDQSQMYISGVISGQQYNVQIAGFRANGVGSGWEQVGPITVSADSTSILASSVKYPDGTPVADLQPAQAGADVTGSHTSADTSSVGGVSASHVSGSVVSLGLVGHWWRAAPPSGGGPLSTVPLFTTHDGVINYVINVNGGASYSFAGQQVPPTPSDGQGFVPLYMRWTGYFMAPSTGTYTIGVNSDDGANLYVNGVQLINDLPNGHTAGADLTYSHSGTIALTAGTLYPIIVEWQNGNGSAALQLLWTPPGASSASLMQTGSAYQSADTLTYLDGSSAQSLQPAQAGADKTSENVAASINGQGALATLNQTNTPQIVVGAVSSQIVYSSTSQVSAPANVTTVLASGTLNTDGGYVKVRCMMEVVGTEISNGTGHYSFSRFDIRKGGISGTSLMFYGNVFIPPSLLDGGLVSVALEAVDTSPAAVQEYCVTAKPLNYDIDCDSISFVVENMKV